jgi:predicted nucleic acid-binding protein
MPRYVIGPDVALKLAKDKAVIAKDVKLFAPTLLRSQVLSMLFIAVRAGRLPREEATKQLDYLRGLRVRLLGDRVLQHHAWKIADQLGWPDTSNAEYLALTTLQADAFVTLDKALAKAAKRVVAIAEYKALV